VSVIFWKTASKKGTDAQEALSRFRQQVEKIVELKHQAVLLKDESEASWRRRFIIETLQAHRILENRESLESKLERHQDFWPKYHQVCRHSEELAELVPYAVIEAELAAEKDSPSRSAGRLQQLGLQGPADWKTRAARSRAGRCTRSPTEAVPSQQNHKESPPRRWQELLDNVANPDSTCKKLRHMMIRRPQLGKGGHSRSVAPRRSKSPAEALSNAHRTPNRKRSHGSKQAFKPADLLKDGNIQSWADLGLGSIGYESRSAKEARHEPKPSSLDQSLQRELKDHLSMQRPSSPRCRRPSVGGKPTVPDVSPVLKRPASACALRTLKDSTSMIYLQVCENQKVLPRPAPILTGHSSKLDARNQVLTDDELEACRIAIAALSKVESVDLEGNVQLTDEAVAKFLVSLGKGPGYTLTFLSLKGCTGTSFLTVNSMLKLLEGQSPAFDALQHLDLSGLKFGIQALGKFCDLAGRHPALQTLLVADVGLGATGASVSSRWIHNLLASQTLRELDLGWNLLDSEVFMSLGESVQHSHLRCLRISSCASVHGAHDIGKPAATFLEYLSSSCPLKELDISLNHIDYRAALVLEDLLSENRHLTALDISFNPIGPVGMRSFVRLLLRERSGLHRVRFEGCAGGKHPVDDLQFMNANCPSARYSLQLDRPDHRSVLRMLYKTCDGLKVNPGEAFFHVQFSEGSYKHPSVGADGIYAVPRKGRLQATFKIEKAIHQHLKEVEEDDFLAFLRQRNDLMRLCPSGSKQILLLHAWRTVSDVDPDQGVFLDALARDVVLPFAVVERMCRSCLSPAEVVSKLFPALRACASERCLTLMIARSIPDVTQILQHARPLMFFNIQNPTGHYRLDLSHPAEHSIAEALVLLDSWESAIRIRHRHVDTSQFGDWSQVRNITFRGSPLQGPLTEWLLPEAGKLELDYSSSARPPEGAQVLDDKSFRIMLIALQDQNFQKKGSPSGAGPDQAKLPRDDMQALRMVAHQIYITALQTRALLECFMDPCDREDCLITFFNRIADMHNEKVFSVRFEGDDEQVNRLRTRLGSLVFFPWVQPEQARFVFQLDRFDERTALCALINLAKKERLTNIQKPRWVRGDGSVDPLVMGLPRSWETFSQIPEHGTVSMSYKCAPEDRNFKVRKSFLQTYSNWPCDVSMEQVLWWASTNEVPVDVMEFLEFIIERYDNVYEAFDDIKSKNAQVLNHRDFEDGLRRVKCKKFKGRREGDKITGIFRYLDPSGEGQVTRSEWGILELCHKEMVYSIQEFVHFCSRSFGNDLNAAWAVFDVNGDNFISEAEWVTVARSFSYFGPTLPIFRFLDRDDEGTISFEEFEELQKFRQPPRPDVQAMIHSRDMLRANGAAMQELPATRITLRARLARARAALAGGRLAPQTTLVDEVILANLQAMPKSTSSSLGLRVATALQRLLSACGVQTGRIRVLKINSFKDGQRELQCDIGIPSSSSPCAVVRHLERALFTEEAQRPESVSLLHVLRAVSAQISTLKVEVRPSRERLVNSLRMAIPKTVILPRRVDAVIQVALKSSRVYRTVLDSLRKEEPDELANLLIRPSLCLHGGHLVAEEPQILKDTTWHGVRELSGLLAISQAAHSQLKDFLAPGTTWARNAFGEAVASRHPCRAWQSGPESLIPNALHFDPGIKKREQVVEEVLLSQRAYELQDTAAHDLWASRLHLYFDTLADLCHGLACAERSLDILWLRNRFREPDCFGYPCVQLGVRQRVQDPRHLSRECMWNHISKITFHLNSLFEAKTGEEAAELREELHAALGACGIRSHLSTAKAAVAHVLDCTEQRMRGSCDAELERVMAFLERYSKELGEEEKGPAKALLDEAILQASKAGCAVDEIKAKLSRCLSQEVRSALGESEVPEETALVTSSQRPVLTRIWALVSKFKVEMVQFFFRDGSKKVYQARALVGDSRPKEPGGNGTNCRETEEIAFDLQKSDYIVAVEQGAVGNSGSLGAQLLFITASSRTLYVVGQSHRRREPLPSRVRVDVHAGEQIVGLQVEFGRVIGVETALEPAVADCDSDLQE